MNQALFKNPTFFSQSLCGELTLDSCNIEDSLHPLSYYYNDKNKNFQDLAIKTAAFGTKPGVAVLEWLDPLMASGNWTPELVAYAGGENIFGEIGQHSPWLTWEELQAADPDVILLSPCGYTLERTMQDVPLLQKHPAWAGLKAVRNGRVYAIDGNQYLNRSGPRLVESAELLARVIWGETP